MMVISYLPRTCPSSCVTGFTYRYWVGMKQGIAAPHLKRYILPYHRQLLIRLRLSSLPLQVEQGKRTNIPRDQRFCQVHALYSDARPGFHHDCVEDIRHFLLECPAYAAIRTHRRYAPIFDFPDQGSSISARLRAIFMHRNQSLLAECVSVMWELRNTILHSENIWGTTVQFLPPLDFQFDDWWLYGLSDNNNADSF